MSTKVDSTNFGRSAEAAAAKLDKSRWSDLQHTQYIIGIWDGVDGHAVHVRELPEWKWKPNDKWRSLRGILSGHPEHDTTAVQKAERVWELEHNERKFGPCPSR